MSDFKMTQEQTNAVMVNASDNAKNIVASADGAAVRIRGAGTSVPAQLCRRRDDLRRRGGAYPGNVRGAALQYRYGRLRRRIHYNDEP